MEAPSRVSLWHSLHSSQESFKVEAGGTFSVWLLILCLQFYTSDMRSAHYMHVKDLKDGGDHRDN